jgi:hypothetical protein
MISSDIIPIYFLIIAEISKMKLEMFLDVRSDIYRGAEGGPERECSVIVVETLKPMIECVVCVFPHVSSKLLCFGVGN